MPSSHAAADPLRLRGDAIAETQGASSPTGLIVLQGEDSMRPSASAEALVWAGGSSITGDVLVLSLRLREPHGYVEARVGRFVLATGAVHPVQIDGVHVIARAPGGPMVETFGGLPVVPRFGARSYDWVAGGRVAERVGGFATAGVSYIERREDGEISDEEVGADLAVAPARWLDLAGFASYDLTSPGISEARASAAVRWSDWRFEVFGSQVSPGRLLPATSLFSVLGDLASETLGATARWRAAPRLDLLASGAGQDVAGGLGGNGWVRATLKLDDRGASSVGLELRRVDVPAASARAQWSGARAIAAVPLGKGLRYSAEIEVVVPDHSERGDVAWPWGLSALSWQFTDGWDAAGALEASATPLLRYEADALLRLSYVFGRTASNQPTPPAGAR
jgi:hypothetical protein